MTLLLANDDPITLDALHACVAPEGFTALLARDGRDAGRRLSCACLRRGGGAVRGFGCVKQNGAE